MYSRSGLGDGVPVLQPVLGTVGSVAGSIAGAAAAPGALALSSLAVPLIGAAIAGVTLAIGLFMNRLGPKQKVYTTKIVNDAEPLLQRNVAAWQASNKTRSEQAQAIDNFNNVWAAVVAGCSPKELGQPGQNCIADRQRGSTKGYDWFALYLDPIANDSNVNGDPSIADTLASAGAELSGVFGGSNNLIPALLIGGLVLLAVSK